MAHKTSKTTPLYAAIRGGHMAIVEKLFNHFPEAINVNWNHEL